MKTDRRKADRTRRTSNEVLRDMVKLGVLYEQCMANSDRLIEAAKVLEKSAFYPQAFFLALTAWEEIGKAQVVADYSEDCASRKRLRTQRSRMTWNEAKNLPNCENTRSTFR